MVLKSISKIVLFFNSYSFFFVITILKIMENKNISPMRGFIITIIFLSIIIISLIITLLIISHAKSNVDTFLKIKKLDAEFCTPSFKIEFKSLDLQEFQEY